MTTTQAIVIIIISLTCALFLAFDVKGMCWIGACPPLPSPPSPAVGCREMAPMCVCDSENCCQWHWVCVQ